MNSKWAEIIYELWFEVKIYGLPDKLDEASLIKGWIFIKDIYEPIEERIRNQVKAYLWYEYFIDSDDIAVVSKKKHILQ